MSDFKFACLECGQKISCDTSYSGMQIPCPACQKSLTVPAPPTAGPVPVAAFVPIGQTATAPPSAAPPPPRTPAAPTDKSRPTPKPSLWEVASAGKQAEAAAILGTPKKSATGWSILAMASLFCSVWAVLGFIPGIVCGHLAKAKLRANPLMKGREMATAGLAISYSMLALVLALGGIFFLMERQSEPVMVIRESPEALTALKPRIVDEVKIGPTTADGNETEHNLLARGNLMTGTFANKWWRSGISGGGFSYDMKVMPDVAMSVNCRYWGSEPGKGRLFDIIVDDQIVGTQALEWNVPGHYFDMEYKIPARVTRGKSKVTVEFHPHEQQAAGGLFGVQILKR